MGNLHSHYKCDLCFAENEATLDDFIQVTFTVSPVIRRLAFHEPNTLPIEDFYFKYRMAKGIRPLPQPLDPTLQIAKGTRPLPPPAETTLADVVLSRTKLLTYLKPGSGSARYALRWYQVGPEARETAISVGRESYNIA